MKLRSLLTYIGLFSIALTLTISCTSPSIYITTTNDAAASSKGGSSPDATSLGFSAWPGWFPWQVAQEQKIFETNKASVNLKWFDGYLESINTLTAQQINAKDKP